MDDIEARAALDRLIVDRRENYGAVSRLLGRNPAYIQQYIKRGTPRRLDERDRRLLAHYFGVEETMLGGLGEDAPPHALARRRLPPTISVPRLALGVSAGAGTLDADERRAGTVAFDTAWLRTLGTQADQLSIIRVDGESMAPTLGDGDDIMVDRGDAADRLRDGVYVLRLDDVLMVKRITLGPARARFSVRSDNPHFSTWIDIDPARVAIVGRVVWTGRKLG